VLLEAAGAEVYGGFLTVRTETQTGPGQAWRGTVQSVEAGGSE